MSADKSRSIDSIESPSLKQKIESLISDYFGQAADHIRGSLKLIEIGKGEHLMQQNEPAFEMYILVSGALEVFLTQDDETQFIGSIAAGECVGEMALLGDETRTATVTARRNALLIVLHREKYLGACNSSAHLQLKINQIILERLKKRNRYEKVETAGSKFIALHSLESDIDLKAFSESFITYWGDRKLIAVLGPDEFEQADRASLENNDFNLLLCTGNRQENSSLMQEADKVVYFAHGETELKELPFEIQERDELILVFNSSSPKTAHSWLQHFRPHKTFRQQLANREHEDRIIRIISESAICLVFGGGGAHGLANLGVIKALNEYKIPVDIIGGSSVGSIIAGALSFDWEYERLHWSVKDSLSDHNPLNDYTLPFVALLRGRKMYRMLHKYFNLHFRDVWKNVFVVAANLSTSKTELIEDGPLDKAIAASISIPGILPPVLHKQGLLVDGGVLNNLPTDIMKRQYRGYVISVDVVSPQSRTIDHRYKVGNKQYLINLITGKRRNYVPGTMNTILKSITLGSLEQADSKAVMSDLYINPRAKKGFLAWKEFAAFEKEGYETAKRILSETDPKKLFNLK